MGYRFSSYWFYSFRIIFYFSSAYFVVSVF